MNSIFVLALCLTAVLAAPQFHDPNHYAQHAQSVQLAKQGQSARLENFGATNTQQISPSDDICGLCESSHSGSELSHATANGVGYVVPVGGSESSLSTSQISSSSNDASFPVVVPVVGGESSSHVQSSSSQTESFGANAVVVPVSGGSEQYTHQSESSSSSSSPVVSQVVYSPSSGSESYTQHTEQISESLPAGQTVVYSPSSGGSESYHHLEKHVQSAAPVVQVYGPSGGSESYHHSEKHVQSSAPVVQVYAPSGGSESHHMHHSEKVIQSAPAPIVPVYAPSGSQSFHHHSDKVVQSNAAPYVPVYAPSSSEHFSTQSRISESGSTIPVAPIVSYSPSSGSTLFTSRSRQHLQQQPLVTVPIFPSSSGSISHYTHATKEISQAAPTVVVPVYGGGGHSVHTESHSAQIKSTPVTPIIYPVLPSVNSHSSSLREHHSSNQAVPQVVYHPGASNSERFSSEHSSSSGNFGGNVGVVSYPGFGSTSSRISEDSSSSSGNFGSNVAVIGYPSNSHLSSRFSSDYGSSSGVSSNLNQYMSESERLARLQAQNIQSSNGYKASSVANFGGAQVVPVSTGGRTKSWEKSSKWASQSEYDHTGTTKTSGFLSTAEGEDETVNGRSAGYRAATTTVENDGKRSTYSIHT